MPIGARIATKTVKRKAKNEAKDAVGLDKDRKREKKDKRGRKP